MLLTQVLAAAAMACASVLAALPPTGVNVVVVNRETGSFFDDKDRVSSIGNPIIGFPFNNDGNQKWVLSSSGGTTGTSGNYTFTAVSPAVKVSSNGTLGAGLNVQATPSVYTITDLGTVGSVARNYRITQGGFAVTAPNSFTGQLTLQTLDTGSLFQHWRIFATADIN